MAAVHAFCGAQDLPPATAQRLAIIAEEIVSNLIEHAGHGRDIAYRLSLTYEDGSPVVTLEDDSEPFDPRSAEEPEMPNMLRGGGVGLALVTAWADIVGYTSAAGWNRLVLRQRVSAD